MYIEIKEKFEYFFILERVEGEVEDKGKQVEN